MTDAKVYYNLIDKVDWGNVVRQFSKELECIELRVTTDEDGNKELLLINQALYPSGGFELSEEQLFAIRDLIDGYIKNEEQK